MVPPLIVSVPRLFATATEDALQLRSVVAVKVILPPPTESVICPAPLKPVTVILWPLRSMVTPVEKTSTDS